MDQIQIVSWLLTRRCNLHCNYCAITRNYQNKPKAYPDMKYYLQNEMSTQYVINTLKQFKKHNPDCFHIFYGGEPCLRQDLPDIINFCNNEKIHYTIISNNTPEIQPFIEKLLQKTDHITGFTASIDPLVVSNEDDKDRIAKSTAGLRRLVQYKNIIKDLVAEITVDNRNVKYLYALVKYLTNEGINSDITFIDISKSPYYDFSNVTDESQLVYWSDELNEQLTKIQEEKLDVHMPEVLFPIFKEMLPSNFDCHCSLLSDIHNVTIDADGSCRCCLRIRGTFSPKLRIDQAFTEDGQLTHLYKKYRAGDKVKYCKQCNWTCQIMSLEMLNQQNKNLVRDLIHQDKRKE